MRDTSLYRIIPFDGYGLREIMRSQALTFVSFHRWEDQFEGYLIQAWKTPEGTRRIMNALQKTGSPTSIIPLTLLFRDEQKSVHMQSWTRCPEKDEMWKIYSPDKRGVRIKTNSDKLLALGPLFLREISYRSTLTLEDELSSIFVDLGGLRSLDFIEIFCRKRNVFAYEEEIRVITAPDWKWMGGRSNPVPTKEDGTLRELSFAHIPGFIESVLVDPRAPDDHVALVERFCKENKIPFEGRSKLHDFVLR